MDSDSPLITYYDIDNINALSYYLSGFQLNQSKQRCQFNIVRRPPRFFEDPKFHGDWRQLLFVLGIFKFQSNGNFTTFSQKFSIDLTTVINWSKSTGLVI